MLDHMQDLKQFEARIRRKDATVLGELELAMQEAKAGANDERACYACFLYACGMNAMKPVSHSGIELFYYCLGERNLTAFPFILSKFQWIAGVNYYQLSEYITAQDFLENSLNTLESLPIEKETDLLRADNYYNLALLVSEKKDLKLRFSYLKDARLLYLKYDDQNGISKSLISIANFYGILKEYDTSISYYQEAITLFEKSGNRFNLAVVYNNLGLNYAYKEEYEKAFHHFHRALEIKKELNNPEFLANSYVYLGRVYALMKQHENAMNYYRKAEEILKGTQPAADQMDLFNFMRMAYAGMGNYEEGYKYFDKYMVCQKQVNHFEKEAELEKSQVKFALSQQVKETDTLRRRKEEIEEINRRLEQTNAELRQFTQVASHDLKEPLRMISSYMSILRRRTASKIDASELEFIDFCISSSQRLQSLIGDLLNLARINEGIESTEVDLNELIADLRKTFLPEIQERGVQLEIDQLPVVKADKTQMNQVLQNVFSNALKYNKSAEPVLRISYIRSRRLFILSISDNGIGIAPEFREKVFDIFFRLHTKEEYPGTGIGLAICKKIIENMGGRLYVGDSDLGGSSMVIELPASIVV